MKKHAHYFNYQYKYLFASFSTKVSIYCASNLDREGWTGGVQVCIQRKGHDWSILRSQTMEWRSWFTIFHNVIRQFFFSFQISSTSQYVVYFLCFCAGTNTVGFIKLLESVEKSSFSVTALLLLLILFYYSFHFL